MNITEEDAARALHDIDQAGTRSETLYIYQSSSPHLLVWGVLWMAAAALAELWPEYTGRIWLAVDAVGISFSAYFGYISAKRAGSAGLDYGKRFVTLALAAAAFITLTFAIFSPVSGAQVHTFITLLVAVSYCVMGAWIGIRYTVIGLAVGALTLSAFFFAPAFVSLMSAGLGGGALVLGGWWLRRV